LRQFKTDKVGFIYSWSPWKPAGSDELGIEFIPMLWGWKQLGDFKNIVGPGFARRALGPNEPDHGEQSAMSPQSAVDLWWQAMEPLKQHGYELISPATTSAPDGKVWLQQFVAACGGCHIDSIAVHWYGTDPQAFIAYLEDHHNTFGRNIYVTEWACQNFGGGPQCDQGQVENFMNTVTAYMDNTPWVTAYFAFGVMHDMVGVNPLNQLMAPNGGPTALGWNYLT
jgi:mono/diheme cytochrome c family protein